MDMWEAHVGEQKASPALMISVLQKMQLTQGLGTQDIIDKIKKSCSNCWLLQCWFQKYTCPWGWFTIRILIRYIPFVASLKNPNSQHIDLRKSNSWSSIQSNIPLLELFQTLNINTVAIAGNLPISAENQALLC